MKVLFVHSRMVAGGVERVTLSLIREFEKRGIHCRLALRNRYGEFLAEAEELTTVVELAANGVITFVPNLTRLIRAWQPTHIVTAFSDIAVMTMISQRLARSRAPLIQGVHLTRDPVASPSGILSRLRHQFDVATARYAYSKAQTVVAVSEGLMLELTTRFSIRPDRLVLIHNPAIESTAIRKPSTLAEPSARCRARLIAIGRLSRQKGFDVLIRALSMMTTKRDWALDVFGDGPDFGVLQELVDKLGLEQRITLRGHTANPLNALDHADWLIMPSRFEGFGLVLVEALARAVPVIASDCPHGPSEILKQGKLGLLVTPDDPNALAKAISHALSGQCNFNPTELVERARDFTVDRSVAVWHKLLIDTSKREDELPG